MRLHDTHSSTASAVQLHLNPAFVFWRCALQWSHFKRDKGTLSQVVSAMNLPTPAEREDLEDRLIIVESFTCSLMARGMRAAEWIESCDSDWSSVVPSLTHTSTGSVEESDGSKKRKWEEEPRGSRKRPSITKEMDEVAPLTEKNVRSLNRTALEWGDAEENERLLYIDIWLDISDTV